MSGQISNSVIGLGRISDQPDILSDIYGQISGNQPDNRPHIRPQVRPEIRPDVRPDIRYPTGYQIDYPASIHPYFEGARNSFHNFFVDAFFSAPI